MSEALADVLLRSAGPYCHYMMLTLALEKGQMQQIAGLAANLDIAADSLDTTRTAAFAWAQEALGANLAA